MKPITGTFLYEITWDIPAQNWGREEWSREFDTFVEAGIDTVIIIRTALRDMCAFPSETLGIRDVPDLVQLFLDESARRNIKLYIGTYDSGRMGHEMKEWEHDWDVNRKFIPEQLKRYGSHPAFHGWYVSPETCIATPGSIEIFKRFSGLMKELTPEKPVLISPYYPSFAYREDTPAERHRKFVDDWAKIFTQAPAIDICAFQDGSCSFTQESFPTLELEDYVKEVHALCREHKITMWNNVETFARNMPIKFPPLDWRWLQRKMAIADPYAEKHITFEFSHFLSPNSIYPSAHTLYKRYRENILTGRPL